MLLRMYLRWAERKRFRVTVLDQTPGEEAGLKSVTVLVEGENAYGLLSTESGVHRLVGSASFVQCGPRRRGVACVCAMAREGRRGAKTVKAEGARGHTLCAAGHSVQTR